MYTHGTRAHVRGYGFANSNAAILPAQPFIWNWAKRQQAPTAAFYRQGVERDRPWQLKPEQAAKLVISPGQARTAMQPSKEVAAKRRDELWAARKISFNAPPLTEGLSEADAKAVISKARNARKAARRWRMSGK